MFVDWSWSVLLSRSVSFELEFLGHSRPVPHPALGIAWNDVQLCSAHRIHERKRGHLFCCLSIGCNNESILSFSPPFCRYPVAGTQFCPLAGYIFVVVNLMMGGKEKLVALSLRFLFLRVGGLNEMRCVGYAKAKPVPVFAGHRSALCCCFKTNSVSCWNCLFFFCCRWLCIIFEKYIERMSSLLCLHTTHQYGVSPYHRLCFSRRHRLTAYAIAMSTAVCSRLSIFAFRFISFGFFLSLLIEFQMTRISKAKSTLDLL